MRIRRNASKLLGSRTLYAIPPATGCTSAAAAAVDAEYREGNNNNNNNNVCELNCPPWDLLISDHHHHHNLNCNLDDYFLINHRNPKEKGLFGYITQDEGDEGISGNSLKTEQEEEPFLSSAITSSTTASELTIVDTTQIIDNKKSIFSKERKTTKKKNRKGKEKDTTKTSVDNNDTTSYCKKSDGKRWHCKRAAQLPHSFCSYRIAKVKSYSSTSNHPASSASISETIDEMTSGSDNFHPDSSSLYFYYEGFGPWRRKRRGARMSAGSNSVKDRDGDQDSSKEIDMEDCDDEDNAIAGDDEYDLDCFDDDDDDKDDYSMKQYSEVNKGLMGKLEKKRPAVVKKRGRKPFKCRSLKSLL